MKQVVLTEEEAMAVIRNLRGAYISQQDEKIVYEIITRIEKELRS